MNSLRPKVSVVIPTLNGGGEFEQCLQMVLQQAVRCAIEVIVVDSGSTDETVGIAERFPVQLYRIRKEDFGHGRTRQWAIERAAGDYIAFLSQDAIPADAGWLEPLVNALEADESVAGAYSRQIPKRDCDPIARKRLEQWVTGGAERIVRQVTSREAYDGLSPWEKRLFINFDDVSSCVRKAVMTRFPFADVPFGEDLEWSKRVLEAGFKVVYEPRSRVFHSHNTSLLGNYRRARMDHESMHRLLGVDFYAQMFASSPRRLAQATLRQIRDDVATVLASDRGIATKVGWTLRAPAVDAVEKLGYIQGVAAARSGRRAGRRKLLLVAHDFPPEREGGVAVYTYHLARHLSALYDVHVFYRSVDPSRPQYEVRRTTYRGLGVTSINNPRAERRVRLLATRDRRVGRVFRSVLRREKPDIVHFQYLSGGLSTGMVSEAKRAAVPALLTINDYWFICPRGQMMDSRWELCSAVIEAKCARCVAEAHAPLSHLLNRQAMSPTLDLAVSDALSRAAVTAPDARFVMTANLAVTGISKPTLLEHPPAEVGYRLTLAPASRLCFSLAMAEETWERPGEGVRFEVWARDGEGDEPRKLFERFVDPKHDLADRRWHDGEVDLSAYGGRTLDLILRTYAGPTGDNQFCTAGWGELRVVAGNGRRVPGTGSPVAATLGEIVRIGRNGDGKRLAAVKHLLGRLRWLLGRTVYRARVKRRNAELLETLNRLDLLIAPSRFLRERYAERGVERDRILVCGYGLNTAVVEKRAKPTTGRLVFGYLGTWMPTKGLHLLVDAFASVPENEAELRVYGSPPNPHHDEYAAVIVQKGEGKPHIRFMGRYGPEQVGEILAGIHVLVVPSIWHENAPLTIHEAFMAGVPVITSNIGGMAELVRDGVDGLHFEVGQTADLHEKIMQLIEDRDLLMRLAAATPDVKSLELHAEELGRIYDDLIARRYGRALP